MTNLKATREKSGKTQSQVANEVKIGVRIYQDYEYDNKTPNVRTAIRIAKALDSTVEELWGEKNNERRK